VTAVDWLLGIVAALIPAELIGLNLSGVTPP
jgi:hypothetical protein